MSGLSTSLALDLEPGATVKLVLGHSPGLLESDYDEEPLGHFCELTVIHETSDGRQDVMYFMPLRRHQNDDENFDLIAGPQTTDHALAAQKAILNMIYDQVELTSTVREWFVGTEHQD